jgi:hypothetical protein
MISRDQAVSNLIEWAAQFGEGITEEHANEILDAIKHFVIRPVSESEIEERFKDETD